MPEAQRYGAGKTPAVPRAEGRDAPGLPRRPTAGTPISLAKRLVREASCGPHVCPVMPSAAGPRTPVQAKMADAALPARPASVRRVISLPSAARGIVQRMEEEQPFRTPDRQYHTFNEYKSSGIQVGFPFATLEEQWDCRDRPSTIEELERGIIEERDDFEQYLERAAEHRRSFERMLEENVSAQTNQNSYTTTTTTNYQQVSPQVHHNTNTQQARTEHDIENALYAAVQKADRDVDLALFGVHPYGDGSDHFKTGKKVQLTYEVTPMYDEIQIMLGAFKEKEVFAAMAVYKNGGDADAKVLIEPGFFIRGNGVAYTGKATGGGFPDIVIYTGPKPTVNTTYKGTEEFQIKDIIDLKFPYPSGGSKAGSWRPGQREKYTQYGKPWGIQPSLKFP